MKFFICFILNGIVIAVLLLVPFTSILNVDEYIGSTDRTYMDYLEILRSYTFYTRIAIIVLSFLPPIMFIILRRYDFKLSLSFIKITRKS